MGQNSIKNGIIRPDSEVTFPCRATYYPQADGTLRLSRIEQFARPVFRPDGWEDHRDQIDRIEKGNKPREKPSAENRQRAFRRASVRCMDIVACNPFDWFCTLTISPEMLDRKSYADIERTFSTWASNRVQRVGLKYIAVPEYHHDGESIHLHMMTNDVIKTADSGIRQQGKAVYNITDWKAGFSTAKRITGENADIACAKYCLKYMRKQQGQKIGGRYFLTGGNLVKPIYEYAETPQELMNGEAPTYEKDVIQDWGSYKLLSFY